MSDWKDEFVLPNDYVAWLVCLYIVLSKVRKEGLMSIEADVEGPERSYIFHRFAHVCESPYLEFATDILRMMVGGSLEADEMTVYAESAIKGLTAKKGLLRINRTDEALLRTIWLTLWASMCGYSPAIAVEFGRQAVPVSYKPTFAELETMLKEARRHKDEKPGEERTIESEIDRFVASLQNWARSAGRSANPPPERVGDFFAATQFRASPFIQAGWTEGQGNERFRTDQFPTGATAD